MRYIVSSLIVQFIQRELLPVVLQLYDSELVVPLFRHRECRLDFLTGTADTIQHTACALQVIYETIGS